MQRSPRMEFLDSIRGLAALVVLLSHSFIFEWPKAVSQFINLPFVNLAFNGKEAVAMFFVLSGFVLSRQYLSPPGNTQTSGKIFYPPFMCAASLASGSPGFLFFA